MTTSAAVIPPGRFIIYEGVFKGAVPRVSAGRGALQMNLALQHVSLIWALINM